MRELSPGEPRAIGRYRIVGVIGRGGMGTVYLGVGPGRLLAAIKQAHAPLAQDPQSHARFVHEVAASRRVPGAYVAAVLDADTSGETPWLATAFVAGPSLEQAVAETGPLPPATVWRLASGLACALREIHGVGLIHRDLKPGNVLLAADGPRVIDFGIAARIGEGSTRLTRTGFVVGSPAYMSPEQVNGDPITPAADLFTLGAVLAFAASGKRPFGSGTSQEMLCRVVTADPDLSAVPPPLHPMIAALLQKDPARRPDADEVVRRIGALGSGPDWLPVPVRRLVDVAGEDAGRLVAVAPVRRSRRVAAGVTATAVVATLAVAVGGVLALAPGGPDARSAADQAGALVAAVLPAADRPPAGFRLDKGPGDPLKIDRSGSQFACDVSADPPLPAEAGLLAAVGVTYREDVGQQADRLREWKFYNAMYLDPAGRRDIMTQLRGRIGTCRTHIPPQFTAIRFTGNAVPGADETVGWISDLPVPVDFPHFPPQVGACEFARVEAMVLRACKLITKGSAAEGAHSRDDELRSATREMLAPLVTRARSLQREG